MRILYLCLAKMSFRNEGGNSETLSLQHLCLKRDWRRPSQQKGNDQRRSETVERKEEQRGRMKVNSTDSFSYEFLIFGT